MYYHDYYEISSSLDGSHLVGDLRAPVSSQQGGGGGSRPGFDLDPIVQKNVGRLFLRSRKFFRYIKAIAGPSVAVPCFARELGAVSCVESTSCVKSTSCRKPRLSELTAAARVSAGGCHGDVRGDFHPVLRTRRRPLDTGPAGPLQ